jgi:hypothetical protein
MVEFAVAAPVHEEGLNLDVPLRTGIMQPFSAPFVAGSGSTQEAS